MTRKWRATASLPTRCVPAPIDELCRTHPSIRRLVFVTGKGSASMFARHFKGWLASQPFVCANAKAEKVFTKQGVPARGQGVDGAIELVVPPSVSPAACRFDGDYRAQSDVWLREVFGRE